MCAYMLYPVLFTNYIYINNNNNNSNNVSYFRVYNLYQVNFWTTRQQMLLMMLVSMLIVLGSQ